MADTGSDMMKLHEGRLGDVALAIGGTLVSPPLELNDISEYIGDKNGFPQIEKLLELVGEGATARTGSTEANLTSALKYGNNRSIDECLSQVWT